jgi:hypothetical protein
MIVFTFVVFSDFIYHRVKLSLHPFDGTKLLRVVTTTVHVMGVFPNFLDLGETDISARVRFKLFALSTVVFESHGFKLYNSYTILSI